jgi:PfaD family protein
VTLQLYPRPRTAIGWWHPQGGSPLDGEAGVRSALLRLADPVVLLDGEDSGAGLAAGVGGAVSLAAAADGGPGTFPIRAWVPPCRPESLGDAAFRADHRVRYAYVTGAMANGIGSVEIVEAMSRAGMLGFFGAAGLAPATVEAAIDRIQASLGQLPYGFNLIHSPNEPEIEARVADLYIRRGVRLVEASAYLDLTLPLVRYRLHGIHQLPDGEVVTPNRVVAKVSRVEVATKFFAPPPEKLLAALVADGSITDDQARMARTIPVAQDVTAEADSGGHTDNRPAITLVPTLLALRDAMQARHGHAQALRVGAAGGIATPASAAAAFAMGASYVLTGSINQSCQEAGTSDLVREMLARAGAADVTMAPAADMFEMGVKVQVLKRGTMFPMRATRLYEIYRACDRLESIPPDQARALETEIFRMPLATVWQQTREFFLKRDPTQVERAERDPRHLLALTFRWYLGQSSRWANAGVPDRQMDYQVWCGPAMGAFNEWVKGSRLEAARERRVVTLAMNLMVGAAYAARVQSLRLQGARVPPGVARVIPMTMEELATCLA